MYDFESMDLNVKVESERNVNLHLFCNAQDYYYHISMNGSAISKIHQKQYII